MRLSPLGLRMAGVVLTALACLNKPALEVPALMYRAQNDRQAVKGIILTCQTSKSTPQHGRTEHAAEKNLYSVLEFLFSLKAHVI